jgi:ABC-type multidrug transport system permease subunit
VQATLLAGTSGGIALAVDIEMGFTDRLLAAPISRFAMVLGRLAGTAALGAATAVWFLAIGLAFGVTIKEGVLGAILMIVFVSLSAVAFGAIGSAVALRTGTASVVQGLFPLVFVILFLSTAFFPAHLILEPAGTVAEYNPLSFVVDGIRDPTISVLTAEVFWKASGAIALILAIGIGLSAMALRYRLRTGGVVEARSIPAARPFGSRADLEVVTTLIRRAANEILRVPGAAIPGVLAPTIFFLGLSAVFGNLTLLPGFTTDTYQSFIIPVSLMQGAGFTGAATGVNLARDIEQGWFDRLLVSPAPRPVLLAGLVLSASLRALVPAVVLLAVGFALGVEWPGTTGLGVAILLVMGMGTTAALWASAVALKFKTQSAAPLMQAGMFTLILTTTAYAPLELLTGWLQTVAEYNPVTQVVEAARQGFVTGTATWSETWPGLLCLAGLIALFGWWALRGMNRAAD